jgi:TFIIF-interacting CTD phosphatase-like protein
MATAVLVEDLLPDIVHATRLITRLLNQRHACPNLPNCPRNSKKPFQIVALALLLHLLRILEEPKKKLLVLDLDETLLHSSSEVLECADLIYDQPCCVTGTTIKVYVKLRPFLHVFLEYISNYFDLAIFTAAHQDVEAALTQYADALIDYIDPKGLISKRLYRQDCSPYKISYLKDLRKFNRPLKDLILLDVTICSNS